VERHIRIEGGKGGKDINSERREEKKEEVS
jgi:hypothetical protein